MANTIYNTTIVKAVKGVYTPSQSWEVFAPRFGRGVWGSFNVLACQGPLHASLIREIEHGILGSHSRTFLIRLWSIRDSKAFGFTSLTLRCVEPRSLFLESHPKHFLDVKLWLKKPKKNLPFPRVFSMWNWHFPRFSPNGTASGPPAHRSTGTFSAQAVPVQVQSWAKRREWMGIGYPLVN